MSGPLAQARGKSAVSGGLSGLDPKLSQLPGQAVAVQAQPAGGLGKVAVGVGQHPGDEAPLELLAAVLEGDASGHHLVHETVEKLLHGLQAPGYRLSGCPVSRSKASRYFARVRSTTSAGSDGTGGCLFHLMASR